MLFFENPLDLSDPKRTDLTTYYHMDEAQCVNLLLEELHFSTDTEQKIETLATQLVETVREQTSKKGGIEAFMMHYDLSTEEGIMLMCLAEALLRIPDKETEDLLIQDKLTGANWEQHVGVSESSLVNMATWGLALTGKVLTTDEQPGKFKKLWKGLVRRSGEPVIRQAVREAIKIMSLQFVLGRVIEEALNRSAELAKKGYSYSYDMLGEVARTQKDADAYFVSYQHAIEAMGKTTKANDNIFHGPSISVKLSALYPRYEFKQRDIAIPFLTERLKTLMRAAKQANISVTIDAEEADRLDMSLDILESLLSDKEFTGWNGLGLAVQAYQKRALPLIKWLIDLASRLKKRIPVRLVKGAYWDSEIKHAQVEGYSNYPVFTRKASTDVSYLACAKKMLSQQEVIYPQFATHNAYSVAAILTMMGDHREHYDFEFQNLQGMGKELHDQIVMQDAMGLPCRIYAPVGSHEDLLPYLVRRLLENGANSSFVNQIADKQTPVSALVASPVAMLRGYMQIPNNRIPLPKDIYGARRKNSAGLDLSDYEQLIDCSRAMEKAQHIAWSATPFNRPVKDSDHVINVLSPSNRDKVVGRLVEASEGDVEQALQNATAAFSTWSDLPADERCNVLNHLSDLLEEHRSELMILAICEAGKTLPNAINEVREAVDFCRYYAKVAEKIMADKELSGPTGELNVLRMRGRGVFACISPWNFPIAIFVGQVVAALVAGNCVIAKPAEQTPLLAARVVELAYEAGVPKGVLQLLPGRGEIVGAKLTEDMRVVGVMFTGSTETAKMIQQSLIKNPERPIIPFIAETGGINAMIADSTALPEQLIADVIGSAFDSAGQRCSALRLLVVQDNIADTVIEMLQGAMQELAVGNPLLLSTDVGPVIDKDAQTMLQAHINEMNKTAKLIYRVELPEYTNHGTFIAPHAYELDNISLLKREVFGPVLHVVRYQQDELDDMIDAINDLGYGLTFGVQSRINAQVDYIKNRIKVGNIYVNRNIVGAVVGVQPFGGCRLSGSGPKAGGPHYLARLCNEISISINTTAAGGNASLMALGDE